MLFVYALVPENDFITQVEVQDQKCICPDRPRWKILSRLSCVQNFINICVFKTKKKSPLQNSQFFNGSNIYRNKAKFGQTEISFSNGSLQGRVFSTAFFGKKISYGILRISQNKLFYNLFWTKHNVEYTQ